MTVWHSPGVRSLSAVSAAALLALGLAAVAGAAPSPSATVAGATGIERGAAGTPAHRTVVSVSWALGAGEYACSVTLSHPAGQDTIGVDPTSTSASGSVLADPGTPITVTLQWVAVFVPTNPSDACFRTRAHATTTVTAIAYEEPPPPVEEAPAEDPPSEPTSETTTTSTTSTEDRVTVLETLLAALAARLDALERASLASWDAFVEALAAGATPDVAALAARSAAMNTLYGVS